MTRKLAKRPSKEGLLDYLDTTSDDGLYNARLGRAAHAANVRRSVIALLDEWLDVAAEQKAIEMLLAHRRAKR